MNWKWYDTISERAKQGAAGELFFDSKRSRVSATGDEKGSNFGGFDQKHLVSTYYTMYWVKCDQFNVHIAYPCQMWDNVPPKMLLGVQLKTPKGFKGSKCISHKVL